MKPLIVTFVLLFCGMLPLHAQSNPSPYRQTLDALASATVDTPVSIPASLFQNAANTPIGQMQRGLLLYAAAGRANELHNLDRSPVLIKAAKEQLTLASHGFGAGQEAQKSQCLYYLGLIAEKKEGNVAVAKNYYEDAKNISGGSGASERLGALDANQK